MFSLSDQMARPIRKVMGSVPTLSLKTVHLTVRIIKITNPAELKMNNLKNLRV